MKNIKHLLIVTLVAVAAFLGFGVGTALAHATVITGTSACQTDGTYTVTWKVANDYNSPETVTYVSKTGGGTVTGLPANIAASPNQPYKSVNVTQSGIAGNAHSASLTVHGVWGDNYSQNDTGTVTLAGNCVPVVTTTTTTVPPTTTTVPPTTMPPTTTTTPPTTTPPTTTTPTTVPQETTTTPAPTTTTPVPTNPSVPEPTTTVPAPTTTVPVPTNPSVPEPTTTAPVETTTVPVVPTGVTDEVTTTTATPFVPTADIVLPATGFNLGAFTVFAVLVIIVGALLLATRGHRDEDDITV